MERPHRFWKLRLLGLLACCLACVPDVNAQSGESETAPARGEFTPAPLPPPKQAFLIPDVSDSLVARTQIKEHWFTLKVGLVTLVDHSAFVQDEQSLAQVGRQEDQWDARSMRLMLRGTFGTQHKVSYLVAGEYKGFETEPENLWNLSDVSLTFPLAGPQTKLTIGKTKETFAYEMVGDAANLPHQERVLSPFFVSRNIGAKVMRVIGSEQFMTVSAGVFNDWWVGGGSLQNSGTAVSARVTGLVWDRQDGTRFLHAGISARYAGADNNTMRYKGRPESNVTDPYVDSGELPGEGGTHLGLEALWNHGPVSLLGEYTHANVNSPERNDPRFEGYYVTASWVLTGETRPYDRTVGYARRVMPTGRWGAPELVARYSHLDLDDGLVQGGTFNKTYLGVNWWATRRWKMGAGWGRTWLDRFSTTGITDSFLVRLQWIY